MGTLKTVPALTRVDLLAEPVVAALESWPPAAPVGAGGGAAGGAALVPAVDEIVVASIDPELADTAQFCAAYQIGMHESANCVVIAGKREGEVRYAACVVLATTRADVNGVVRRRLGVRKASFAAMSDAVAMTGMEYGGITPIGLPKDWPVLVDQRVVDQPYVIIGSGVRHSKIALPGVALAALPQAEVVPDLARPIE